MFVKLKLSAVPRYLKGKCSVSELSEHFKLDPVGIFWIRLDQTVRCWPKFLRLKKVVLPWHVFVVLLAKKNLRKSLNIRKNSGKVSQDVKKSLKVSKLKYLYYLQLGPVDNRPANDYHQHFVREKKCDKYNMTLDIWCVTHDIWHVICDTWYVTRGGRMNIV